MYFHNDSPLTSAEELIVHEIVGAALAVHRELGPGYLESFYRKAICVEMRARAVSFELEKAVDVSYRGTLLGTHRVDLVVEGVVIVELKAVERLDVVHRNQVVAYLEATKLRVGLLVSFNAALLKQGLRRVVL